MRRHYGGMIGTPTIPSATAAPGCWKANDVARQLGGSGLEWPDSVADAQFATVTFLAHCNESTVAYLKDYSSFGTDAGLIALASNQDTAGSKSASSKFGAFCVESTHNSFGASYHARLNSAMGTGDFTLEGWIYRTTAGISTELMDMRTTDSVSNGPFVLIHSSNTLRYLKTGASFDITGATTVTTNTWHHWHCTRASGVVYLGLDGTQEGSDVADTTNYTSKDLWIGRQVTSAQGSIVGRYDELRVSKYARYARTYAVPTAPFPNHA